MHTTSQDGTSIAHRVWGSGPPLLFVHGAGTSGADWIPALAFLRDRFTVATMDRRGRGDSGDAAEYGIDREAEDVVAVIDAVGAELLVAHSYGALCSIRAAERTERLRRIVLYEPPIAVRAESLPGIDELIGRADHEAALDAFLRSAGASRRQINVIRSSRAWSSLLEAVPPLSRELHAAAAWRSPGGPIDVPALFLLGADTESSVYLEGLDELQAAFREHRTERIPGHRHFAHVFAAEDFAKRVAAFCGD